MAKVPDGKREQRDPPKPRQREALRPQDEQSARAKSSGHGKKTADKWNQ